MWRTSFGASASPSAGRGRARSTLRGYAREAGFEDVEILPVENDSFRFYRMRR